METMEISRQWNIDLRTGDGAKLSFKKMGKIHSHILKRKFMTDSPSSKNFKDLDQENGK